MTIHLSIRKMKLKLNDAKANLKIEGTWFLITLKTLSLENTNLIANFKRAEYPNILRDLFNIVMSSFEY